MNCLIIGFGSIGSRHARILKQMGNDVYLVSHRKIPSYTSYSSIPEAFKDKHFDYVLISNRTCDHYKSLLSIIQQKYKGLLLIEKPLFDKPQIIPEYDFSKTFIAYNLRFHPIIQKIHTLIKGKRIYSIQSYVGQYLPDWRPSEDYRKSYSASRKTGGGVLLDLSHELDYLNWLVGPWESVTGLGGTVSDLEIDCDDVFCSLMQMKNCPVVVLQMNYLDRTFHRELIVNMEDLSFKADLIKNVIQMQNDQISFEVDSDYTYHAQHRALINGDSNDACDFEQSLELMDLIQHLSTASRERIWIKR